MELKAIFLDAVGTVMTMEVIETNEHTNLAKEQNLSIHEFVISQDTRKWKLYPETIEVLDKLKSRGYKLALISNFDDSIHTLAEELGIAEKFDLILSSEEARASKPNPKIYNFALEKLELVAEEALMIGDSYQGDYAGPKNIGMEAIYLDRRKDDLKLLLEYLQLA